MSSRYLGVLGVVVASSLLLVPPARAETVLSRISVPNPNLPGRPYGQLHRLAPAMRDYSAATLFGYSFQQELADGSVRELRIARVGSPAAYLMATDLFPNGRFSTMSHTVVMVFPRQGSGAGLYRLLGQPSGDFIVVAPDGSRLLINGTTGAVRPSRDFYLAPIGPPGTPPDLRHRGFHLVIRAVGQSPFLRGTPVLAASGSGESCRLWTDDVFAYESGPESDAFRFSTDASFFALLAERCPGILPQPLLRAAYVSEPDGHSPLEPVAVLKPAAFPPPRVVVRRQWHPRTGGLLSQLLSR